jgi:hypothetical protein
VAAVGESGVRRRQRFDLLLSRQRPEHREHVAHLSAGRYAGVSIYARKRG